jgi:hypothetical protein
MAEEALTPYQDWTQGELKGRDAGAALDLGMRGDRAQRKTAPGGSMAPPKQSKPAVVAVAGETREQRELRQFLASGEAKAQLDAMRGARAGVARLGSERPGSERPGSRRRQGSSRPASERPASERFQKTGKGKTKSGPTGPAAPQSEKSKRKEIPIT